VAALAAEVRAGGTRAGGARAVAVVADLTTAAGADRVVEVVLEEYGRLDAAFDNAGNGLPPAPLGERAEDAWDAVHALNLRGTRLCLRAQPAALVAGGRGGSIVVNSGVGALVGGFGDGVQQAAKHGLTGPVRAAVADYAPLGIRVNAVAPGVVRTPGTADFFALGGPFADLVASSTPLGRSARTEEVAQAAAWLLSDRASYVTGVTLPVDGGITATRRFD